MKIGILTPHSQLNFGGVLQAWAMLEGARIVTGSDTVFLDWWCDEKNSDLERGVPEWSRKHWVKIVLRAAVGGGDGSFLLRQWRTKQWMKRCYRRTPYHFCHWSDVQNVGVDLISVGSDQVWHYHPPRFPDPFLLENAPDVPSIAYAASFGMRCISEDVKAIYATGFSRFRAISVREKSAVEMVHACGAEATHVADPTLLVGPDFWRRQWRPTEKRRLVYYKISSSVSGDLHSLEAFARRNHCKVDVFVDSLVNQVYFPMPFPHLRTWACAMWKRLFSPVRLHLGAGPMQFVKAISQAKWVMTDSFHGLMFSTIFSKNVRVIKPTLEYRVKMFARISDFVSDFIDGSVIVDSLPNALASFEGGETIDYRDSRISDFIASSREWLSDAVEKCEVRK